MNGNKILTYETMRHVALEIVQLGRDVPEEQWFEDAEHYATSLIRRLCEEAYDEGRQGELSSLGEAEGTPGADPPRIGIEAVRRAKLLDNSPTSLTTDNIPVATDVYLRHLEPFALQSLRRATEEGLVPSSLDFGGDDGSIVRLRLIRLRAG